MNPVRRNRNEHISVEEMIDMVRDASHAVNMALLAASLAALSSLYVYPEEHRRNRAQAQEQAFIAATSSSAPVEDIHDDLNPDPDFNG
jgi:hypothetical protein